MADIKATEVIGQLRKLVRMFDAVSAANDTINMLCGLEQTVSKLNAEVARAEEAATKAKAEVDKNVSIRDQLAEAVTQQTALLHDLKGEYDLEQNALVTRARKEADRIVGEATATAKAMDGNISSLNKEKDALETKVTVAKDQLLSLQQTFLREKERMTKALEI